ncbi:MAG: hypothetical protein JWQ14_3706 [Adhaeribacter sp.]|nr:hypothetical protein [Adhaeribacter sp.]
MLNGGNNNQELRAQQSLVTKKWLSNVINFIEGC